MCKPKNWYSDSRKAVKLHYGTDWRLFCKLLAATSPNCALSGNLTLAQKAYDIVKRGDDISEARFVKAHRMQLTKILSGKPCGQKVSAFYQNLIGNENAVTVDIWIARRYGLMKPKAISKRDYKYVADSIRMDADFAGVTPAQWQAMEWCKIRGDSTSFGDLLRRRGRQLNLGSEV